MFVDKEHLEGSRKAKIKLQSKLTKDKKPQRQPGNLLKRWVKGGHNYFSKYTM